MSHKPHFRCMHCTKVLHILLKPRVEYDSVTVDDSTALTLSLILQRSALGFAFRAR